MLQVILKQRYNSVELNGVGALEFKAIFDALYDHMDDDTSIIVRKEPNDADDSER